MGKLTKKKSAAGALLIVIGLFNGVVFAVRKVSPKPKRRSRWISGAALEAAYQEAAADADFRREMNELAKDFDVALQDGFEECGAIGP
jgi:hypothetical protein